MKKPIKITYIIPDYKDFGGIQTLAKDTAKTLRKASATYVIEEHGWYFKEIPLIIRALLRYTPSYIGKKMYDAIVKPHFLNQSLPEGDLYHYWCVEASLPYNLKPYIVSVYGRELLKANLQGFRYDAYKKALINAEAVHACSDFTKKLILRNFSEIDSSKILVINPPAHEINHYKRSKRQRDGEYVVGTLTRLVGRKNVASVIKAVKIVQDCYKLDIVYHLAGDGPDRRKILYQLKQAGIKYKYFGKIDEQTKLQEFYPSLDVFVLPPLETRNDVEGFGIVFLEANASGVPVVAADTGGVSDAIKDGVSGLFANPLSPKDIAEKIHKILSDKKDWQKSSQAWTKNFNQENTAVQFQSLYKKVLEHLQSS